MTATPQEIKNKLLKTKGDREKKEFQDLQSVFLIEGKPTPEQEMTINDAKKPGRIISFGLRLMLRFIVLKMIRNFLIRKVLCPLTNENSLFQRILEIILEYRMPSPSAFHEFPFYWLIEEGFREIMGCVGVQFVKATGN